MLSVEVSEEDPVGLELLAAVAGVGESDSETFAGVVKSTFHSGVMESCKAAGLTWPPGQAGSTAGGKAAPPVLPTAPTSIVQ